MLLKSVKILTLTESVLESKCYEAVGCLVSRGNVKSILTDTTLSILPPGPPLTSMIGLWYFRSLSPHFESVNFRCSWWGILNESYHWGVPPLSPGDFWNVCQGFMKRDLTMPNCFDSIVLARSVSQAFLFHFAFERGFPKASDPNIINIHSMPIPDFKGL